MNKLNLIDVIGRCELNIDLIKSKMPEYIMTEYTTKSGKQYWQHIYSIWGNNQKSEDFKKMHNAYERSFPSPWWGTKMDKLDEVSKNFCEKFDNWADELESNELVVKCYYRDSLITLIGVTDSYCWVFPSELVTVNEYKNYDRLTKAERNRMLTGLEQSVNTSHTEVMEADEISKKDLLTMQADAESNLKNLEQKMQDVKEAKIEGLAEIQAEIDAKMAELEAKKSNMMAALEKKKSEMELMIEKMNFDIFKLDSEIYAIRCYTGEVLELKRICSGKCASEDTPLIFHQKMRYLDEELGKLASLYNVDYSNVKQFEEILKVRKDIVEYFAPSERSVMLVRVSRTNQTYRHKEGYTNVLECYKKYHGKKVGIIIRDGENLYIAWTDDERIFFSDDAFYKPGEKEVSASDLAKLEKGTYETEEKYQKRMRSEKMKELRSQLGRYYVFTLLQGMIDRNVIKFPEKVNVRINSAYIVWSYADGWITTNEYGTFSDMIERCNKSVKAGDMILTTDSIRPKRATGFLGGSVSQAYHNDRGIGDRNRTHDVNARDNTIYPVNLIKHYAKYEYEYEEPKTVVYVGGDSKIKEKDSSIWSDQEYKEVINRNWSCYGYKYKNIQKISGTDDYKYYISLEKDENWMTGKSARANFNVYKDEFINLTFMNSVWLEYVLTNHKDGGIQIHGETVDFAYVIPYIKNALSHVRKREEQVAEWIRNIDSTILDDEKWVVKLSEWMLEKDIHNFSEFRTKQFVKSIKKR